MATTSFTQYINNLTTMTWANRQKSFQDNIFTKNAFFAWMKGEGSIKKAIDGGEMIEETLQIAKNSTAGFIGTGAVVPLRDTQISNLARYPWRRMVVSVINYSGEMLRNYGTPKIMSIIEKKITNAELSMYDLLEETIFGVGTGEEFLGLQDIVADDPTATGAAVVSKVGGINQSTNEYWRNQTSSLASNSFATAGPNAMRKALNGCVAQGGMVEDYVIVCGQQAYEFYDATTETQRRVTNKKMGDYGFETIEYKGIPVIWSPKCNNERMYFLNTRHLSLYYHPQDYFEMTEFKTSPNTVDHFAQITLMGNMGTDNRRVHHVIHGINTA